MVNSAPRSDEAAPTRRSANALLSFAQFSTSLPVVGKRLEWMGPAAAIGLWGYRQAPALFGSVLRSRMAPGSARVRSAQRESTAGVIDAALLDLAEERDPGDGVPASRRLPPLLTSAHRRRRYVAAANVSYGDDPALVLDVWRRPGRMGRPAPVLVFIPGGGWIHGSRAFQGYALLSHLAERGWICVSVDYRVAPNHKWPSHIDDITRAVEWTRSHIGEFGGDERFVAIAGCSAGGHLAALAAVAPDVSDSDGPPAPMVNAAVGLYGRYDWQDRSTRERRRFMDFLERVVVGVRESDAPEMYAAASPIGRVTADAPPFFVVHGTADAVIPVRQARDFVARLRAVSTSPVGYLELPGAGHAFDIFDGARTDHVTAAIGQFLRHQYELQIESDRIELGQ